MQQSGVALSSSDTPGEAMMDVDNVHLPDGTEQPGQVLDQSEERVLVRESTAGFAGMCAVRRMFLISSSLRLDCIAIPPSLRVIREFAGGRRPKANHWRQARRDRAQVDQEHDGCHMPSSIRAVVRPCPQADIRVRHNQCKGQCCPCVWATRCLPCPRQSRQGSSKVHAVLCRENRGGARSWRIECANDIFTCCLSFGHDSSLE